MKEEKSYSKKKLLNLIDNNIALLEVSEKIGYTFPKGYEKFYNDGMCIKFINVDNNEIQVKNMISMDKNSDFYIEKYVKTNSKVLSELIPIAVLESNNLLCFDRNNNNVVFYNQTSESIKMIADTWEDFIRQLAESVNKKIAQLEEKL